MSFPRPLSLRYNWAVPNRIPMIRLIFSLFFLGVSACATGSVDTSPGDTSGHTNTGECSVFPADNPWNKDISSADVHLKSTDFINSIGAGVSLHPDFGTTYEGVPNGFRYAVVPEDQPLIPITFEYADESDPGPYPIPADPPIEASANGGGDRHLLIIQQGVCKLFEVFAAYMDDQGWHGGSGAVFDLRSNQLRPTGWTSADAAGLPIFPGLVRYEEVEAGEIRHALRITVPQSQKAFIYPATHYASTSTLETLPPMGLRVRLKSLVDLSVFPQRVQVILRALQKYGAFVADNGSAWYLSGVHNPSWDDDELRKLSSIVGGDFEAVETGEIHTSY